MPDASKAPENKKDKILHVRQRPRIGIIIMGSDILDSTGRKIETVNNNAVSVGADSNSEIETIYNGLSKGGNIMIPQGKTFMNTCYGMFTDKSGVIRFAGTEYGEQ